MRDFFVPYVRLRARQPGYAVSIVKAGAAIVGRGAGPVRPPLSGCTAEETGELAVLIEKLGPPDRYAAARLGRAAPGAIIELVSRRSHTPCLLDVRRKGAERGNF
jgi:hypothetical protein